MATKNTLTAEQIQALVKFAAANGRNWKSELRYCWMQGYHRSVLGGASTRELQILRNTEGFGPRGLIRFSLKSVVNA